MELRASGVAAGEEHPSSNGCSEPGLHPEQHLICVVGGDAEFGVESGTNKFVFAVRVTGVVAEVDDRFIIVDIAEMADADVRIPLSTALNGAPIRDVTDTVSFGDFANQTEYQQVANEYKLTVQELVLEPLDLDALGGSTIEVVGAWTTGGPPDTYIIHPVRIEVADD